MSEKISVIIPVYKVEKYLDKCIESVVNQTHKNLEIILVDDGSPDNCPAICDKWAKKDVRIRVIHKQNGGLSDARNAGLDIATGEYIGFVDSDDAVIPEMYEELLKNLQENDADISACGYYDVNSLGYKIEKEQQDANELVVLNSDEVLKYVCFEKRGWELATVHNKLYKAAIWQDLRFEKGKIHEDEFAFNKVMKKRPKTVLTKKQMYLYLRNDNGIMATRDYNAYINGAEAFVQRGREYIYLDNKWHSKNLSVVLINYFSARQRLKKSNNLKELNKIEKEILSYISLLRKENKISVIIKFGKILTIKHTKIRNCFEIALRLIYTPLKKRVRYFLEEKEQLKQRIKEADFLLFNTVTHGNLGDHAIVLAEKAYFFDVKKDGKIFDLTGAQVEENLKFLKRIIPKEKTIFVCGGGNIGCLWPLEEKRLRNIVRTFPKNKIVFFPQTVTVDMKAKKAKDSLRSQKRFTLPIKI